MRLKKVVGITLTLLLISMLTLAFNVQPVEAEGPIYIRADGSIDPPAANITSADNITYYFTDDNYDGVVVERDNIVVDGAGFTLTRHVYEPYSKGIDLTGRSNVTIKNVETTVFWCSIWLNMSSNNNISGNNIPTDHNRGISLYESSNNTISGNNIKRNTLAGIMLHSSSYNSIFGNNITNNSFDVLITNSSCYNSIFGNNIVGNETVADWGIPIGYNSNYNSIFGNNITGHFWVGVDIFNSSFNAVYHNNFANNSLGPGGGDLYNIWDDGYPYGGNYYWGYAWVDEFSGPYQNVTGSDGIGDAPYILNSNNTDHYPLMNPYTFQHNIAAANVTPFRTVVGQGYSTSINVTVRNRGDYTETFNVTTCYNTTIIETQTFTNLPPGKETTITLAWNTTGIAYGNYTLTANATQVPSETYLADNTYTGGLVLVSVVGDVNGDCIVDGGDQIQVGNSLWSTPADLPCPQPKIPPACYNPNTDVNGDGTIDGGDQITVGNHLWESWP